MLAIITKYWVEWACMLISTLFCIGYKTLSKRIKKEQEDNLAIKEGIKALLHDKIISKCEQCLKKGYCTIEEMDEILYLYEPYKRLNGNGSAERAFVLVKHLPTVPPEGDDCNE